MKNTLETLFIQTIEKLRGEWSFKPTTPKQIRFLGRLGFKNVEKWSYEDADLMVNLIFLNGWRVPGRIIPDEYKPA